MPFSLVGNQELMVEVMPTGVGPSVRPSSRRSTMRATAVVAKPIAKVTIENSSTAIETIWRVPKRPIISPAGIWETA